MKAPPLGPRGLTAFERSRRDSRGRALTVWDRARVGGPLFHDVKLQRAFWEAAPALDNHRLRAYVDQVFAEARKP